MNKFIAGLAVTGLTLTALMATPALAQMTHQTRGTAYIPPAAADSYAFAGPGSVWNYPNSVYVDGEYRGTDPDAAIRMQLKREPSQTQN